MTDIVYRTVHLDWKLQNNREKRSISRTKEFYRNPLVGNLENVAKITQVGIFYHINLKRSQEVGNKQTDKQTKYCNPRAHARRALTIIVQESLNLLLCIAQIIKHIRAKPSALSQNHVNC